MPATFSGAVSATSPAIVDTNASQDTGAASQGIGLTPADGASIGGFPIGAATTAPIAEIVGETGDGVGV